jgi:hypothetical protein
MDNILINFYSGSLGDTLAWMPIVEEYRRITKNNIFCICKNDLYKIFNYPNINFCINHDEIKDVIFNKVYNMGYWVQDLKFKEMDLQDPRTLNLQEVACDILKIPYKPIKPNLFIKNAQNKQKEKYACISVHSTAQSKYWNYPNGWNIITNHLVKLGYKVICIDKHKTYGSLVQNNNIPENAIDKTGDIDIQERISDIYNCEFFIGLASGLSWLAWALNKKVILISGFSDPKTEFYTPYRIINKNVCNSCWNDQNFIFDPSDISYCPRHKNTSRMFECSKEIHPNIIIDNINKII